MNKTEERIVEALDSQTSKNIANTTVSIAKYNLSTGTVTIYRVFLHGNQIAYLRDGIDNIEVKVSHCSWETNTTKSRLNMFLEWVYNFFFRKFNLDVANANSYHVFQHNWEWYICNGYYYWHMNTCADNDGWVHLDSSLFEKQYNVLNKYKHLEDVLVSWGEQHV
jgi:hypothetical protein